MVSRAGDPGLASRYPNDAGIGKDPAVFFHDNFESTDLKKWDEKKHDWKLYTGTYTIVAGSNADDEKLSATLKLQ